MNVIVIVSDTCRKDRLGCYGNKEVHTPAIDYLASQSAIFERCYCASFPTVPHRTDCFLGRYGFPFYGWVDLPREHPTLSEILGRAGVRSQLIHDTPGIGGSKLGRGFDGVKWNRGQAGGVELRRFDREIELKCTPERIRSPQVMRGGLELASWWQSEDETFPARTMKDACRWLEVHRNCDNFLLWVDTFDPHEPWLSPMWYVRLYYPDYEGEDLINAPYDDVSDFTPEEIRWMNARYNGELTMVDKWIGVLLEKIEELNLLDRTAVIFTSDHGFLLGEHNKAGKHTIVGDPWPIYEEIALNPLLIRLPDGQRGTRFDALVQPVDIHATILDLFGVPVPESCHGKSLLPLIRGETSKHREFAFSSGFLGESRPALVSRLTVSSDDGWSLICHPNYKAELYRVTDDPKQQNNLIASHTLQAERLFRGVLDFLN